MPAATLGPQVGGGRSPLLVMVCLAVGSVSTHCALCGGILDALHVRRTCVRKTQFRSIAGVGSIGAAAVRKAAGNRQRV